MSVTSRRTQPSPGVTATATEPPAGVNLTAFDDKVRDQFVESVPVGHDRRRGLGLQLEVDAVRLGVGALVLDRVGGDLVEGQLLEFSSILPASARETNRRSLARVSSRSAFRFTTARNRSCSGVIGPASPSRITSR